MDYKVLGSIWFNKVGIVRVQTAYDGIKYYIGQGDGLSMEDDEQYIAAWGSTVAPDVVRSFMEAK